MEQYRQKYWIKEVCCPVFCKRNEMNSSANDYAEQRDDSASDEEASGPFNPYKVPYWKVR